MVLLGAESTVQSIDDISQLILRGWHANQLLGDRQTCSKNSKAIKGGVVEAFKVSEIELVKYY